MILSFTGHRPDKLGYEYNHAGPLSTKIIERVSYVIEELQPEHCNIGMCIGFDFLAAIACNQEGFPYIAYIPFLGQESKWSKDNQKMYRELVEQAYKVIYVSEPPYTPWKMTKRNQAMIDDSHVLCAGYDGSLSGGTFNTVEYAKAKEKDIIYINPKNL